MTDDDTRSLSGAAQAALRKRAIQAVLGGMTQAEAARVFGVHPNAVNRWINRYREGGFQGLSEQRRIAVQGSRRPSPNRSSRRSSRWSAKRPRTSLAAGVSVYARCGRRADRAALWRGAGAHHPGWVAARLGVQPAAATRAGVAVRLLAAAFPPGGYADPGVWPACASLLPHALAATGHAEQHQVEPLEAGDLLNSAGSYLRGRARYAEARALHERALAIREASLGADHPSTMRTRDRLAALRALPGGAVALAVRGQQTGSNQRL
jgi:transposase-like protein